MAVFPSGRTNPDYRFGRDCSGRKAGESVKVPADAGAVVYDLDGS